MIIEQLRAEASKIDRKNPKQLLKWFTNHPELTTADHAVIFKIGLRAIPILKRRAGLTYKKTFIPKRVHLPLMPSEVAPPDWRHDVEWLKKVIGLYGLRGVGRIVNRDKKTLKKIIDRYGITYLPSIERVRKNPNPCCTFEWCHRHYVQLKLSQAKCAKLAGVNRKTITRWLARFDIAIHTRIRAERWVCIVAKRLSAQPVVKHVLATTNYLEVKYRSSKKEYYYFNGEVPRKNYYSFKLTQQGCRLSRVPLLYYEYGVDATGKPLHPAHVALSRADFRRTSLLERRLGLQAFASDIKTRGWIRPTFPDAIIEHDFDRLKNICINDYKDANGFQGAPRGYNGKLPPGLKTMLHFFDCSYLHKTICKRRILYKTLEMLLLKKYKFNYMNLVLAIARNHFQHLPSPVRSRYFVEPLRRPAIYMSLFKHLNVQGQVLDLKVGPGSRALACAAAGIKYTTIETDKINYAIDNGFLDFSGLDYTPYCGDKADVAIYDGHNPNMEFIMEYLNKAKTMLVYVKASKRDEMMKYKPRSIINIRLGSPRNRSSGFMFVW